MSEYDGSKLDSMERRTQQASLTIQTSPASVPAVPPRAQDRSTSAHALAQARESLADFVGAGIMGGPEN
jgi:hypothetical protein